MSTNVTNPSNRDAEMTAGSAWTTSPATNSGDNAPPHGASTSSYNDAA